MKHHIVVEHQFVFRKKNTAYSEEKGPIQMQEGINKLKKKFNENPVEFLVVASLVAASAAKLIDAMSAAQGRRAYAQQVQVSKVRAGL